MINDLGEEEALLVFDIGMFDGSDSQYYMEQGWRVVAIEANPMLADAARQKFSKEVRAGSLTIVNAAIAEGEGEVELSVCGEDLGSSSVISSLVANRIPLGTYRVPTTSLERLVETYGVPHYLKVDIEGADGVCVRGINSANRPRFLSFEIGEEFLCLFHHLQEVGYSEYKLINQVSFREASREGLLRDRIRRKLVRMLGYSEPGFIRVHKRFFRVAHSSGPGPWESDGTWVSQDRIIKQWEKITARGRSGIWYDLQAR